MFNFSFKNILLYFITVSYIYTTNYYMLYSIMCIRLTFSDLFYLYTVLCCVMTWEEDTILKSTYFNDKTLWFNISQSGVAFIFSLLLMRCRRPRVNPLTAKLFNLNFYPHEVVSRRRDPQLQVSENYSDLTKWKSTLFKSCWLMSHFILYIFKMWYLKCANRKWKPEYMRHRRLKG